MRAAAERVAERSSVGAECVGHPVVRDRLVRAALPLERPGQGAARPPVGRGELDQPGQRLLGADELGGAEVGAGEQLEGRLIARLGLDDRREHLRRLDRLAHREEQVRAEELRVQVELERLRHAGSTAPGAPPFPARPREVALRDRIPGAVRGRRMATVPLLRGVAMALRLHLPHRTTPRPTAEERHLGARVFAVQRIGAIALALVLLVFGLLGFAGGLEYFSTNGQRILGLSSNGLLSTISVVVAVVLLVAAARSPRTASTVMIVIGALFLLSALVNLAVMRTSFNILAFQFSNVVFSVVVGLLLLVLGSYGRIGGHLPEDSPYAHPHAAAADDDDEFPSTPAEVEAERAMRDAEVAVVQHYATPDQRRRVEAMAKVHSRADRRRLWMSFDDRVGRTSG